MSPRTPCSPRCLRYALWPVLCGVALVAAFSGCRGDPKDPVQLDATGGGSGLGGSTFGTGDFEPFYAPPAAPSASTIDGLESITVQPTEAIDGSIEVRFDETVTLTLQATGEFDDGSSRDITDEVTWSTNVDVASAVDGNFEADAPGAFVVRASAGSVSGSAEIAVRLTDELTPTEPPADWPDDVSTLLDSAADGTVPVIAYPLDGALFPSGFTAPAFQVDAAAGRTVARVSFQGEVIDLRVLAPCVAIAGSGGCEVVLDARLTDVLVGASTADDFSVRVRLMNPDGTDVGESQPVDVRWSSGTLSGAIYYWRSGGRREGSEELRTSIARLDLSDLSQPTAPFWSQPTDTAQTPLPAPPWDGASVADQQSPCVGCHAISRDGNKLAVSLGGSDSASFALIEVGQRTIIDSRLVDGLSGSGFAQFTTFNPPGSLMVNSHDGQLVVRRARAGLEDVATLQFPGVDQPVSHPFWSDRAFVFVSYPVPGLNANSDLVSNAQIWAAHANPTSIDLENPPQRLVAGQNDATHFFPSVSSDGGWVVFVSAHCSSPATPNAPYGEGPCDGYDDIGSTLRLVSINGGDAIELPSANGGGNLTNSWPRFSPNRGQRFRGQTLYWIAFSSRRSYGLRIANPTPEDPSTPPQIWFAAIALPEDGSAPAGDPSFAPIWLPNQNDDNSTPTGNHVPQWTTEFVVPE